jgi:hypothetical protein
MRTIQERTEATIKAGQEQMRAEIKTRREEMKAAVRTGQEKWRTQQTPFSTNGWRASWRLLSNGLRASVRNSIQIQEA